MLKTLKYFLMAFLFLFLISIAPLLTGIKIDNLNYNNLSFNGLYLKYDKSLIVSVDKLTITSQKNIKTSMSFSAKIESFFDTYYIDVKKFTLDDPHLKFSGKVLLEDIDYENFKTAKFHINDFKFLWDKNLDWLKATQAFIEYKNNSFYFKFNNPVYKDFKVDGTTASITNIIKDPYLNMYFYSKDNLKKSLIDLISYYGVDLPIVQEYGKNNTYTKVIVPLTLKKLEKLGVDVFVDVDLKSSKLQLFEKPVYAQNINVLFQNNIATIKGILKKEPKKDEKYNFEYDGYMDLKLDFTTKEGIGSFKFDDIKFRKTDFENIHGDVKAYFEDSLILDFIFKDNVKLKLGENNISIDQIKSTYKNEKVITSLKANDKKSKLSIDLNDSFDLKTFTSKGNASLGIKNDSIETRLKNIKYDIYFEDDFNVLFSSDEQNFLFNKNKILLSKINGNYFNDKLTLNSEGKIDFSSQNYLVFENLTTIYDTTNNKIDFNLLKLYNEDFSFFNIKGNYSNDIILFENQAGLKQFDLKGQSQSSVDLKNKVVNGEFLLKSFDNKSFSDAIEFKVDYKNSLKVDIPTFGFNYHKNQQNHIFKVDDLDKVFILNEYFKSKKDQKGNLYIYTNDFEHYNIYLNNSFTDLKFLDLFDKNKNKNIKNTQKNLNLKISSKNGTLKFKEFLFNHDNILAQLKDNNLDARLISNKTVIDFSKNYKGVYKIKSKNIQNSYLNSIIEKNILYSGNSSLDIIGFKDIFKGDMKLKDTTIKDVAALNSLILFINTTPALINPLLSIPSLFRFTQTGFSINGYEISKGELDFTYRKDQNKLYVNEFTFDGKMNDFKGFFTINTDDKKLDGKVDIVFMKDYAKVLNYIPGTKLLNANEDVIFYKTVDIDGTIDEPEFSIIGDNEKNIKNKKED